jgi:hypothetical protein
MVALCAKKKTQYTVVMTATRMSTLMLFRWAENTRAEK